MASSFWKGVVGIGLFSLAHAAFSAAQHRSYMRLTEKEHETLPIDIVLQTLLSFVMTCYGIVHIAGEFKDMDASSELKNKGKLTAHHLSIYSNITVNLYTSCPTDANRLEIVVTRSSFIAQTFDTLRNHPSFYLFNHRGRLLFRTPEEEPSSVRNQQALPNPIRLRKLEHLH